MHAETLNNRSTRTDNPMCSKHFKMCMWTKPWSCLQNVWESYPGASKAKPCESIYMWNILHCLIHLQSIYSKLWHYGSHTVEMANIKSREVTWNNKTSKGGYSDLTKEENYRAWCCHLKDVSSFLCKLGEVCFMETETEFFLKADRFVKKR